MSYLHIGDPTEAHLLMCGGRGEEVDCREAAAGDKGQGNGGQGTAGHPDNKAQGYITSCIVCTTQFFWHITKHIGIATGSAIRKHCLGLGNGKGKHRIAKWFFGDLYQFHLFAKASQLLILSTAIITCVLSWWMVEVNFYDHTLSI